MNRIMIMLFVFQLLADGVVPNEYGINPQQKLKIGSKVNSFFFMPDEIVYSFHIFILVR